MHKCELFHQHLRVNGFRGKEKKTYSLPLNPRQKLTDTALPLYCGGVKLIFTKGHINFFFHVLLNDYAKFTVSPREHTAPLLVGNGVRQSYTFEALVGHINSLECDNYSLMHHQC